MNIQNYPRSLPEWKGHAAMNEPAMTRAADYLSVAKTLRTCANRYVAMAKEDYGIPQVADRYQHSINEAARLRNDARWWIRRARDARNWI